MSGRIARMHTAIPAPSNPSFPQPSESLPQAPPIGGHVPALDGLRGLAILLVMLLHFGASETLPGLKKMDLSWIERAYLKVADAGGCGRDLFFVLFWFFIQSILFLIQTLFPFFSSFYS